MHNISSTITHTMDPIVISPPPPLLTTINPYSGPPLPYYTSDPRKLHTHPSPTTSIKLRTLLTPPPLTTPADIHQRPRALQSSGSGGGSQGSHHQAHTTADLHVHSNSVQGQGTSVRGHRSTNQRRKGQARD